MIGSRLRRVLLSGAVLAGALVTLNAPAAQAHYGQCPSGHCCIWQHNSYEGERRDLTSAEPRTGWTPSWSRRPT
ncbi:peptidase inhibitor family I36 protein [Streptomyces bobili]|uniref:peptidase inhibitor family I36 protein n=1 Tax=Streptomyces bobili TaxID=67280 RepID=UPI0036FE6AFD